MAIRWSQHLHGYKHLQLHFLALSAISIVFVFCIALLSRAELRLSGQVLGAGDGGDLALLFALRDCHTVELLKSDANLRLHRLSCNPYDYVVESVFKEEEWKIQGVERLH